MMEVGTLKELDVKPGDVVEFVSGSRGYEWQNKEFSGVLFKCDDEDMHVSLLDGSDGFSGKNAHTWKIFSRASDTPKTWGGMTDAEKGALLLAELRGETIESSHNRGKKWKDKPNKLWHERHSYRIKSEPKRETVAFRGHIDAGIFFRGINSVKPQVRISFDMIDGEPDTDTIRMERI